MRFPSNFGQPGGFNPVPFDPRYPPPMMPVSVTYHYEDGSFSVPQMVQTGFPVDNGYREYRRSLNPNASEFIPSYWRPEVEPPYNGTVMNGGGQNCYEESYSYIQDDMSYVPSTSGATPTPIFEGEKEPFNYLMPPPVSSELNASAAGNSQALPKEPSNIVYQVQNVNSTDTSEANEQCNDTCCTPTPKKSMADDETPAAMKTPKVAIVLDDDAKKSTEKIEVVPIPVQPVQCFPLYGFIGFHYGLPEPPMPESQKLIKLAPSKEGELSVVLPPTPKSTPKKQASPPVPQFSVMPLPLLPIPQVPVPNNYQPLSVIPSKNGSNSGQYTCIPPGFVKIYPKNIHFVHPQQSGK